MKSKLTRPNTVAVALKVLMASFAPAAYADKCSTQTVGGDWALSLTGTIIRGGVQAAAIASGTFDENGTITKGTEARNVGGDYADETLTGYWTVNSDCTGTLYVNVSESGQLVRISVATIVFDDSSKEVRMVQKSLTARWQQRLGSHHAGGLQAALMGGGRTYPAPQLWGKTPRAA